MGDTKLLPEDIYWSEYPERIPGVMYSGSPRGVMAVHKPTAIKVICDHLRSQHENRDACLRALSAALLARQEGEDWLPIESAPRDGSVIDLFGRERFASCFWDSVSKEWRQYYSEAIPCSFSISDETPTHWRRLPTAPAARPVSGG